MASEDLGELASSLANMNLSLPSGPDTMLYAFQAVKAILTDLTYKLARNGFELTDYRDLNLYIDNPSTFFLELDFPINIDIPDIQPQRSSNGLIYLKALNVPGTSSSILSDDGFVRSDCLKDYMIYKLDDCLSTVPSGWSMQVIHGRHGHCQTIEAKSQGVTAYINMIPVIEFQDAEWPLATPPVPAAVRSKYPWYAVPWQSPVNKDNRTFTAYAPLWLTEALSQFPNCIKFLNVLMACHAKRAKDFPNFSPYMLKCFMLRHVAHNGDVGLDQLISIMPELMTQLNNGKLESGLIEGHNMLECLSLEDIQQCLTALKDLHTEAQYDSQEFWDKIQERLPSTAYWFFNCVAVYSYPLLME